MKIQVSELRLFKKNAAPIKANNILPINNFLKFETGKITKNALNSFIVQKSDIKCDPFLVDEKQLWSYIDSSSAKEIDISVQGKKVVLSAPGISAHSFPTERVDYFPSNEAPDVSAFALTQEIINCLAMASRFILEESVPTVASFVFMGDGMIAGGNGAVGFAEKADGVPKAVFYKTILHAVTSFSDVDFTENDSFYFFDCGNCKYGFAKQEVGYIKIPFFQMKERAKGKFTVNKREIIQFNDLCVASAPVGVPLSSLEKSGKLTLRRVDADYNLDTSTELDAQGDDTEKFNYNPSMMNIILKNIEEEVVTFSRGINYFSISGESNFVTIIMQMQ